MSEYTLDIVEAAKSLSERECNEIESELGGRWKYPPIDSVNSVLFPIDWHIVTIKKILGKWKLIGKKRTEKRTIKYWLVVWKDGSKPNIYYQYPDWAEIKVISQQVIPLSHTYTYTFPPEGAL